ncbi:MAG: hypothetical protein IJT91_05905 [Clostridia bacterium]|nr:hypothetical protein [Clostridia bacterium]
MTNETKRRIKYYKKVIPGIKEKLTATMVMLLIAMVMAMGSTFAWVTLSRSPEVTGIATSLASNGALEIALSKESGEEPDEFDIDESVERTINIVTSNLQWGNLVNLSDPSYGIDNLALRPAQLNTSALLNRPLKAADYGDDGRVKSTTTNYAYASFDGNQFITSNDKYGVRAIASYTGAVSSAAEMERQDKINDLQYAHENVNTVYNQVPGKFGAMGTMISKYAQDKLDGTNTNLAPYIQNMIPLYEQMKLSMEAQKEAYVALANFQNYMYAQNSGSSYNPITWDQIAANKAAYNCTYNATTDTFTNSTNGIVSLVGLTQFITDYNTLVADLGYLNQYNDNYKNNGTAYYWGSGGISGHQIANIVANLIDYGTMTIDLKGDGKEVAVTALSEDNASDLLAANGQSRSVYTYNGIAIRFEQLAIDDEYRMKGRAACTIKVTKILTITVNGKAYTKAKGPAYFTEKFNKSISDTELQADATVAEDTYGMAIDLWVRTNAETTCLTLEGAVVTDINEETGEMEVVSYDGVNRIWGSTNQAVLTTDSTTQGGGSFYVYYADTPEDMERSLKLLEAMKIAFVSRSGKLLATASMDTVNYYAVNGRITVPLVLDSDAETTYTYTDALNQEMIGRAITTLEMNVPQRIEAIVYLDGTHLFNENVLAVADIQGQLNIQFGSSTDLTTVGDNDLIDKTRVVDATVTKTQMNFDTAVTDDDMTTDITVNVSGANPTYMTAFFVREINKTQGSREQTMTFTKQEDGTWTSSYKFESPGTYYLRYIRLDGVDYALHDPQRVDVAGFALRSVRWGEPSDYVEVNTSANTYSVPLYVEFASSDRSKMPSTVNARFFREDGNAFNVPMTYNVSSGLWTGKAEFSTSETYTLKYLLFDENYKDLTTMGINKVIKLSLGMYVTVANGEGALREEYYAGNTYSKDVSVRIFDNAGNEMTGLTGARLYYSNGGSATNTINTDLTWNEVEGRYEGTLPIVRPGRYRFSSVQVLGNYLTKCTESPSYVIVSPNPPTYDNSSQSSYFNSIQFAPMTNDAVIDNIKIADAESATITAVVYNDIADKYFTVEMGDNGVSFNGTTWTVKLPTYTLDLDANDMPLENAKYTQEGEWKLVMLSLTDCYDENGVYREAYVDDEHPGNPLIFAGSGEHIDDYLSANSISVDKTCNFYPLTTTVSCTVKATLVPGTTALGSSSTPFMTRFPVSSVGMYALITDDNGNVIPSSKVSDVTLTIRYEPNSNSNAYGYKVLGGAAATYNIKLNAQDPEDGHRTVSEVNGASDFDWQYVGVYTVSGMKVTLGSNVLNYVSADNIGLPEKYTITTGGPAAENIELLDENIVQRNTVLGKTGQTVTGTFLQALDPGITAKATLTTEDGSNTQYVVLDDVSFSLVMTYQSGKTAPNGGYSWSGTSDLETVNMNLNNNSGTFMTYATPLLAGVYKTQLKCNVGGAETTKNLENISVFSKTPTVKVSSVTPAPATNIQINPDLTSEGCNIWANVVDGLLTVQNYKSDYVANVYAGVSQYTPTDADGEAIQGAEPLVAYTLPEVVLSVTNLGTSFDSATATIGNESASGQTNAFTFSSGGSTTPKTKVGYIEKITASTADGGEGCGSGAVSYQYDSYKPAGEQTFNTITAVKNGISYTVNLTDAVTIRENNFAPPSIQFVESPAGYTTPEGQVSDNGDSFTFTLPSSIGQIQDTISVPVEGAEWTASGTPATQKICYVDYPNTPTEKESGTRGSCSSKYSYWIYEMTYTYYKFTKTTTHYTLTTGTNNYSVKKGVTKWIVGGVEYNPGQTITVSSVVTATPVIDELPGTRTFLNSQTQTGMKDRIQIVSDGTESKTVTADSDNYNKNQNNTKAAVQNQEDAQKPSGYEWGNSSNKKEAITVQDYYTDPVWG